MSDFEGVIPQKVIEERARGAIAVALLSHARDVHVGAGAKRLAAQTTTEYHNRFLIELVQNAHDAHNPGGNSGHIELLFDREEAEFGVLYVANRGRPFSPSNFKTICELGLSDKPPGEAIGNKGIGFKSVLQICERPEIYSRHPGTPPSSRKSFDGFCFSFATDTELLALLEGDRDQLNIVRAETAGFHLPVPLREQPGCIDDFARKAFATVVRLPLRGPEAVTDLEREMEALRNSRVPLLLFLDRLKSLEITESRVNEGSIRTELRRSVAELEWPEASPSLALSQINLQDQGKYLAASVQLEASRVEEVVQAGVDAQELDETWLEWKQPARITAAVRLDRPVEDGRLYTFLPMEVAAPFAGHLNAPFYARLDRRSVNRGLTLNALLLDAGARACRLAAQAISNGDRDELAAAAVDFFSWERSEADRLDAALGTEHPASEAPVLPVRRRDGRRWGPLSGSHVWNDGERRVLTTEAITAATEACLLDAQLGPERIARLTTLCATLLGESMTPSWEQVAEWCERIAEARAGDGAVDSAWWDAFYDDLATMFDREGRHLQGRRILLDEEGSIQSAWSAEEEQRESGPTVFFQPVRERAEGLVDIDEQDDVRIPKSLQRHIAFLHPGLQWLKQVGTTRQRKRSRQFLEDSQLVRPYAARSILEHIRDLLRGSRSKRVFQDALRLAYRLHRTRDYDERPALRELRLRVPCRGGWVEADTAHFSDRWPQTTGGSLERLITLAAGRSNDLREVADRLLLPPQEWPFTVEASQWIDFLKRAGVRDGLWPMAQGRRQAKGRGSAFTPERVARQVGIPDSVVPLWLEAVSRDGSIPQYGKGDYRNQSEFYYLPAQADYRHLSPAARQEYAALVAASSRDWDDDHFSVGFQRVDVTSRNLDPFKWPTPLAAFVRGEVWVPLTIPRRYEEAVFAPLAEAWHFSGNRSDTEEYTQPAFAPLLALTIRRHLDSRPQALERLRAHGLNVWNAPGDSPRLIAYLAELVQERELDVTDAQSLRRAYEQAWSVALKAGEGEAAAAVPGFVVTRGGQVDFFQPRDNEEESLYVHDGGSRLGEDLLRLSGRALMDIEASLGLKVRAHLEERLGPRVKGTSTVQVVVLGGDVPVEAHESDGHLLTGALEWLEGLVMSVVELKRPAFRRLTPATRERTLETLRSIRLRFVSELRLRIDDATFDPPHGMREAVPLQDERFPTIVVNTRGPELNWRTLETLLPALSDLINYGELAPAMQLAVNRLAPRDRAEPIMHRSSSDIATALDEPEQRVHSVIRGLRRSASGLLDLIAPALVVLVGLDTFRTLERVAREGDEGEGVLLDRLADLDLPVTSEELRALAWGASGRDDLRRSLGLALSDYNNALEILGRPVIRYDEENQQAFAEFIAVRREEMLRTLRRAHIEDFRNGLPLDRYVNARDRLPTLDPDPAWAHVHEIPPDYLMEARLDDWVRKETKGRRMAPDDLEPLEDVRRGNRRRTQETLGRAQPVVLAWCQVNSSEVPGLWDDDSPSTSAWNGLLGEGLTDFEPIDPDRLFAWLSGKAHWPQKMPQSLDLTELGLSQELVDSARTKEEWERAQREILRHSVELGGVRYRATGPEDFSVLAEAARESLTESLLRTRGGFSELVPPAPKGKGSSTERPSPPKRRRLTESQRNAIGLIGEVIALEWLKRRYKGATDDSWKSRYRDVVLGGSTGDDSLGYDFEVPSGRTSFLFEVKASAGEETQIELGESQVLTARGHARTDRYRILYLTQVLDPQRRSIHVLPNPFSEGGRDLYRLEGSGLRYHFRLGDSGGR